MGLEKLVLQSGQVLLSEVDPTTSGVTLYGSNYLFGTIAAVSGVCDNYKAGDSVIYDTGGSTALIFETTSYSLITEDKIYLKELA
jgi:hypothetical protein